MNRGLTQPGLFQHRALLSCINSQAASIAHKRGCMQNNIRLISCDPSESLCQSLGSNTRADEKERGKQTNKQTTHTSFLHLFTSFSFVVAASLKMSRNLRKTKVNISQVNKLYWLCEVSRQQNQFKVGRRAALESKE